MKSEIKDSINLNSQMSITPETESYLRSAARWSYFLSIIGFISILFIVIVGIIILVLSTMRNEYADFQNIPFNFGFIGIFYFIFAVLNFFPAFYLIKFGSKINSAFDNNDQIALVESMKNLKKLFKFIGIMVIITISLSVLIVPAILIIKSLGSF